MHCVAYLSSCQRQWGLGLAIQLHPARCAASWCPWLESLADGRLCLKAVMLAAAGTGPAATSFGTDMCCKYTAAGPKGGSHSTQSSKQPKIRSKQVLVVPFLVVIGCITVDCADPTDPGHQSETGADPREGQMTI